MMNKLLILLLLIPIFSFAVVKDSEIYTLYRNLPLDFNERIHVATFDADAKEDMHDYNMSNCMIAQEHFQKAVLLDGVKFWCEKGRFKK